MRQGYALQSGFVLYRLVSLLCGVLLMSTLGLVLVGHYVQASMQVCVILGLRWGVRWLLMRRVRQA
jgi:hypothetical protein